MVITILTSSVNGGAGHAAHNLFRGLEVIGAKVNILTVADLQRWTQTRSPLQRLMQWWRVRKVINGNYRHIADAPPGFDYFSFATSGWRSLAIHPLVREADVLNIHWVANMLDYPSFFKQIKKPAVFTLHDTNAFTGGCHYTYGCEGFAIDCSDCPQLAERVKAIAAKHNLALKIHSLALHREAAFCVVSPSEWLRGLSERSNVLGGFPHRVIRYGIDTLVFREYDRAECRSALGIPADKFVVFFAASSLAMSRKGFREALEVREQLSHKPGVHFVCAGSGSWPDPDVQSLGKLDAQRMAHAYAAADVFLAPSIEDNLPNTVLESLCCGTPVIAFSVGGIPEAVHDHVNGFLAVRGDTGALVKRITELADGTYTLSRMEISERARIRYSLEAQAVAYLEVMKQLVG